jgi:DNA-3-methyladenine glycosylase II
VLARVIDDHPDFDPDVFARRLPAMDLFGALVFQVIGQQISVIAATAIFARLTGRFGGRVPDPGELAAAGPETLHGLGLSRRLHLAADSRDALNGLGLVLFVRSGGG